jgi:hypothetical protein
MEATRLRPRGARAPESARHERAVRDYYRHSTALFGLFARQGGGPLPIHRGIWAPGVRTAVQSLRVTNARVAAVAAAHASCLDLGCGVGATLAALGGTYTDAGPRLAGITLSPVQARAARRHLAALGLRATVVLGSYLDPGAYPALPRPRLLVAVESMVHATDARRFLDTTAGYASPGDTLLVVDDFVAPGTPPGGSSRARRLAAAVRAGWRAPSLGPADDFIRAANVSGWRLEHDEDWSARVRTGSGLRRALAAVALPLSTLPLPSVLGGLVGGSALLLGYRSGVFRYRFLLFRRQ